MDIVDVTSRPSSTSLAVLCTRNPTYLLCISLFVAGLPHRGKTVSTVSRNSRVAALHIDSQRWVIRGRCIATIISITDLSKTLGVSTASAVPLGVSRSIISPGNWLNFFRVKRGDQITAVLIILLQRIGFLHFFSPLDLVKR